MTSASRMHCVHISNVGDEHAPVLRFLCCKPGCTYAATVMNASILGMWADPEVEERIRMGLVHPELCAETHVQAACRFGGTR